MLRRLRPDRFRLRRTVTVLLLAAVPAFGLAVSPVALVEPVAAQAAGTGLSVEQARAAAIRILDAVQRGDASARYAQFAPDLQAITSPSMIAATMRSQPRLLRYQLLSVQSGLSSSTVEADLFTTAGEQTIFIVLNAQGQILRYSIDRQDDATSKVAERFVQAITSGNFITAHSFLSPDFQKEITPQALQDKWLNLQRLAGSFVRQGRVVEAEQTADVRLVLVNVQFNRLSDNLFVILNGANQITGLDFPANPEVRGSVR